MNLGYGKCGFQHVMAPRKTRRNESQSESKGLHCYGSCSHVPAGLPCCEVNETSEDQDEGKDLAPHRRCLLHRGDTTFRLDFFINRMN